MEFLSFAGRRAVHTAVTLVLLLAFMFVLFRLIPGDPTTLLLGTGELTLEAQQRLRAQWGLDQLIFQQLASPTAATCSAASSACRSTTVVRSPR